MSWMKTWAVGSFLVGFTGLGLKSPGQEPSKPIPIAAEPTTDSKVLSESWPAKPSRSK